MLFGFVEAESFGISDNEGFNYPAFMAMELKKGYLDGVHGRYFESSIYDDSLNRQDVKKFDESFEPY